MAAVPPPLARLLLPCLVLLCSAFVEATTASFRSASRSLRADPVVEGLFAGARSAPSCSCDCCLTARRSPNEEITTDAGDRLTHKCASPAPTDLCPARCGSQPHDIVLDSAVDGVVDTDRYCGYKCRPSQALEGAACVRLDALRAEDVADATGNGTAQVPPLSGGDAAAAAADAQSAPGAAQEAVAQAEAAAELKDEADEVAIAYDISAARTQRILAETGEAEARAASAAASVSALVRRARMREATTASLVRIVAPPGRLLARAQTLFAETEAAADAASSDREEVQKIVTQTAALKQRAAHSAREEVRKKALAYGAKEVAQRVAAAKSDLQGWARPENYGRVLAARRAAPYQQAGSDSLQRSAEYAALAVADVEKADAIRREVATLGPRAATAKLHGELTVAAQLEKEIEAKLSEADDLEAKAKGEDATARGSRDLVAAWQDAAVKASNYALWQWQSMLASRKD